MEREVGDEQRLTRACAVVGAQPASVIRSNKAQWLRGEAEGRGL